MKIYAIGYNKDKNNEIIEMICFEEDNVYHCTIGDMYNLYDFLINNDFNNDKMVFSNFTNNQLEKIINHIIKYKNIDSLNNYNSLIVSNKKKTRSLNHAKVD